jgi:hypothetical protein
MAKLQEVLKEVRSLYNGFNPPASEESLTKLQSSAGPLSDEVLALYLDHDGSNSLPQRGTLVLTARLMPVAEVLTTQVAMNRIRVPKTGAPIWLWTDDNSNYCGVYTDGPLSGWVTVIDHEEPMLAPAFRSVSSFVSQLLVESPNHDNGEVCDWAAYDIPQLTRKIPTLVPDPANFQQDRELSEHFRQKFRNEGDDGLRRLYAFCTICLTPFECTGEALAFLDEKDMWTPGAAIRLMELRRYPDAVERLERLAQLGIINTSNAALSYLVRLNTSQSREAISRLKTTLVGHSLRHLERLMNPLKPLPTSKW